MFGYISINRPELKVKEYDTYRTYYCGVCHSLKDRHGQLSRLTLSFDMTFLALLLDSLYESNTQCTPGRCLLHPFTRHPRRQNRYTDYAADMNILLSYYNLMDDWKDDHNYRSKAMAELLKKEVRKLRRQYPRQSRAVSRYVQELSVCENNNDKNIDHVAGLTGEMLAEIFVLEEDVWSPLLRRLGFFLGKFIYLMDAWEDLEKDQANASYNLWLQFPEDERSETALQILNLMMSECSLAFEQLPILENAGILRNVLYSGVWTKYSQLKENPNHV